MSEKNKLKEYIYSIGYYTCEESEYYYLTHTQERNEYSKRYHETHKEQIKEYDKKYRETHKEQKKKYREEHKEQQRKATSFLTPS